MATTVRSLFFAATAAVFMALSGCGGGGNTLVTKAQDPATVAFSAPVAVVPQSATPLGQPKKRALSASSAPLGFSLTANFTTAPAQADQKALAATAVQSRNDKMFDWAEAVYQMYFPSKQMTKNICIPEGCFDYRFYPETGNYVGVRTDVTDAGGVYLAGSYVGTAIVRYAHIDDLQCFFDVDSCRPYVKMFSPENGAANVPAKGTVAAFTYGDPLNGPLNCADVGGTGEIGSDIKIIATVTCNPVTNTVSVTPVDGRWPFGSRACLTIGGIRNQAGFGSLPETLCFTTSRPAVSAAKVYIGNFQAEAAGFKAAAVIDTATSGVTPLKFPGEAQGFGPLFHVAVDPLTAKVWFGSLATAFLYSVDLETGQVLTPVSIDQVPVQLDAIQGLALAENDLCMAFGRGDVANYSRHNQVECRDRSTLKTTFTSPVNWLGTRDELPTLLRYLPYGNEKKLYALVATTAGFFFESLPDNGFRDGVKPGMRGTVVAVDVVSKQTRTFVVGSGPQGIDQDPTTGDLYVVNTGDRTLSIITRAGQVHTEPLAGFTGLEQPLRVKVDRPRGYFYVTNDVGQPLTTGKLMVYRLDTHALVKAIPVRRMPIEMAPADNLLYVTSSWEGAVTVVDLDTLSVTKTIELGTTPSGMGIYVPAKQ